MLNGYHMCQIMIACSKEIWEIFKHFEELILFLRTQVIRKHRLELLGSRNYHFFKWVGSIQNTYLLISEVLPPFVSSVDSDEGEGEIEDTKEKLSSSIGGSSLGCIGIFSLDDPKDMCPVFQ